MNKKKLRPWKTLSRKTILNHSKFLKVESHEVQLPDGEIIPDWGWVIIHDAALILAQREDGKFLVFRQRKYAIEGTSLAPVGGMLETDEEPLEAAKRELREEMGYESSNWINLGSYLVDPNCNVATMHLFLALDAKYTTPPDSDDLEEQELLLFSKEELEEALNAGEFKVINWALLISLALRHLSEHLK
jgi:ADP-ribose pyrophosphatase